MEIKTGEKRNGQKGESQIKGLDIVSLSFKRARVVCYIINCCIIWRRLNITKSLLAFRTLVKGVFGLDTNFNGYKSKLDDEELVIPWNCPQL